MYWTKESYWLRFSLIWYRLLIFQSQFHYFAAFSSYLKWASFASPPTHMVQTAFLLGPSSFRGENTSDKLRIKKLSFSPCTPFSGSSDSCRHKGHRTVLLPSGAYLNKQPSQKLCKHGKTFGVLNLSKQTWQSKNSSLIWLKTESCDKEAAMTVSYISSLCVNTNPYVLSLPCKRIRAVAASPTRRILQYSAICIY